MHMLLTFTVDTASLNKLLTNRPSADAVRFECNCTFRTVNQLVPSNSVLGGIMASALSLSLSVCLSDLWTIWLVDLV